MKKLFSLFLGGLLFSCFNLNAQDKAGKFTAREIGIYSSVGVNNIFTFQLLDGAAGYRNDGFIALGGNYIQNINRLLDFEIAVEYSKHNVLVSPSYIPFGDMAEERREFKILSFPVMARINVGKYFYLNGGLLFSFDMSKEKMIDNQTGIGGILGLGVKYNFDRNISVFINPYSKVYPLIPFLPDNYHQRVWENGIRIGLMYNLGK